MNEVDPNFQKKRGLRRNPKAFSDRNWKFKRFFRPKTADLQKKGLRRNPKAFSGRNQKFKRFFRPKTVAFSSHKPALKSRWGTLNLDGGTRPPRPPHNLSAAFNIAHSTLLHKQHIQCVSVNLK